MRIGRTLNSPTYDSTKKENEMTFTIWGCIIFSLALPILKNPVAQTAKKAGSALIGSAIQFL
jgi:hypothetical protein